MTNPYRKPARVATTGGRARRTASQLAVATAIVWGLSVVRLVVAYERHEGITFEPALAALLTAAPPVALVWRSLRDPSAG